MLQQALLGATELLNSMQSQVVLHGDIHHGNILDFGAHGWLAIDPKGLLGERGFDFANIFCNPDAYTATKPGHLERQAAIVAHVTGIEPARNSSCCSLYSMVALKCLTSRRSFQNTRGFKIHVIYYYNAQLKKWV